MIEVHAKHAGMSYVYSVDAAATTFADLQRALAANFSLEPNSVKVYFLKQNTVM